MKGVGRIYQQTFVDTYSKVTFAKLYDCKTPITAADLLNDRIVPFFDEKEVKLSRVLTDRGTEYCGNPEHHEYELCLALEDIDHSRTKTKSPQMASVSASTRQCWTSSIVLRSARSSMLPSMTCRRISIYGSEVTMRRGHIKGAGALAKRRCKLSSTPSRLRRKKCAA
jgi:hypothetical protein